MQQTNGPAGDGRQAVELFRKHLPDVILMDLRMPGMGGVEAIRAIHAVSPDAGIIVLTTYQGYEDIHRALTAGADGTAGTLRTTRRSARLAARPPRRRRAAAGPWRSP